MSGLNRTHITRIMKDLVEFYRETSKQIFLVTEDTDITKIHAIILGPEGTPYESGYFYFLLTIPSDYPLKPPKVKFMTTGGNKVRFNPNLYSCGKVCLSILGTWSGPKWTAAQTLFTTLLSIQSLMNEKPYHNEPGHEEKSNRKRHKSDVSQKVQNYNDVIAFETMRVAVIGMLDENSTDTRNMPEMLKNIIVAHFKTNYEYYERTVRSRLHMDHKAMENPHEMWSGLRNGNKLFQYKDLLNKLHALKTRYDIVCDINDDNYKSSTAKPRAGTSSMSSTAPAAEAPKLKTIDVPPNDPLIRGYYDLINRTTGGLTITDFRPDNRKNDDYVTGNDVDWYYDESQSLDEYEEDIDDDDDKEVVILDKSSDDDNSNNISKTIDQ
ncbi:ubiquitin-conjugating enzyme E2 Z-like [Oppia nitens]|uniref:ubiquitin-conjugating enzyme E2 Z-like n=1 Tax=Oppia nitens TaxID=1686743 RepID=UPI0023DB3BFE|nr:ubiquitin-conjugating enzyme E2 Z-like [Oppia nitens]